MRRFRMIRTRDSTGVSGTGHVLDGVVFENGWCVCVWRSKNPSVNVYGSFTDFEKVHIDSHPENGTLVEWLDPQ